MYACSYKYGQHSKVGEGIQDKFVLHSDWMTDSTDGDILDLTWDLRS